MPDDDPRTRVTSPPRPGPAPIPRGEDNPPLQPRSEKETIARVALRAQKKPEPDRHEELLRAIAATESKLLDQIGDEREAFEEKIRREIRELIVFEAGEKPAAVSPASQKAHSIFPAGPRDVSWFAHLPALVVAIGALVATIAQSCSKKQEITPEMTKKFDDIGAKIDAVQKQSAAASSELTAYKNTQYAFALDQRAWIADVLERAASVKVDDPPGAPPRERLKFYPTPVIDPHRITDTHTVQPRDPYPIPPPP